MKNFIIFYLLVILLNLILPIDDIISFKIESFQYNGEHTNSQIINQLYDSNLVTTVKIGSYSYPLKTFVDAKNHYFFISSKCNIEKSHFSEYKTNFNYNRYRSNTFKNTSSFNLSFSQSSHACTANEEFEFYKMNRKEVSKESINFILVEDTSEDIPNCLHIGLLENKNKESSFSEYNLITQLKQKNSIKENCWSIIFNIPVNYNNDYLLVNADELLKLNGNLYIGDYPHIFDSKNYFESQLVKTYTKFEYNMMRWELNFNKIYYKYNNKEIKILANNNDISLDPSKYFIIVPEYYYDSIKENYFQKYLDNDICHFEDINEYTTFYCKKSDKFSINEIKQFPSLYFEHVDLEYTFELSFKDLFIEKDGNYYVLFISDTTYDKDQWVLGNIFMRKYQFVFNLESKEIGFYNPNLEKKQKNNENDEGNPKDSSKIWLIVLLIIAVIIIIVGVVNFIKMKFYNSSLKKKRANELDDDFDYISHKNKDNNNYKDNQLFNESINQD
jgi:hypothetical protein